MELFTVAWFALMRRNYLYRKRYWVSSVFEFLLPWIFLAVLIGRQSSSTKTMFPPRIAQETNVRTLLRFQDYLTALQAKRICLANRGDAILADFVRQCLPHGLGEVNPDLMNNVLTLDDLPLVLRQANVTEEDIAVFTNLVPSLLDDCRASGRLRNAFYISGMDEEWPIPMIKCDATLCTEEYQNAEPFCERSIVGLSGDTDRVRAFITWVEAEYPVEKDLRVFYTFDSAEAMDTYVKNSQYGKIVEDGYYPKLAMGIVFEEDDNPSVWKYQLRPNSTNSNVSRRGHHHAAVRFTTPDTSRITHSYARTEEEACPLEGSGGVQTNACMMQYAKNGVLTYQRLIHDFILNQTNSTETVGSMSFVPVPSRSFEVNDTVWDSALLTFLVTLGLLYPVVSMVSYIVKEKQFRQKELMKTMNVTEVDIELSWLLSFVAFHFFTATVASILSAVAFAKSFFLLLWVFWMLTMIGTVILSTAIAAITSKTTSGVSFATCSVFAGFLLSFAQDFESGQGHLIRLISLHPIAAFCYGVNHITKLEKNGLGLTPSTARFSDTPSRHSFNSSLLMLVIGIAFWGSITWYLNRVVRPEHGEALPFYFPLQKCYWFPPDIDVSASGLEVDPDRTNAGIPFETVDDALGRQRRVRKTIEIRNLRKAFNEKNAVEGLTLTAYSGHITALLGLNGAGKTTTLSMLMGTVTPTDGYATILGKDIRKDLGLVRKNMGVCLQQDVLFPDLTVWEHVQFFAQLKGMYEKFAVEDADRLLNQAISDVALFEQRDSRSKFLSMSMKRKLSLCLAFCGGSKLVLLDEPTNGMNHITRRFTWDCKFKKRLDRRLSLRFIDIRKLRQDRCVILTTRSMDEAGVLGDRLAIMARGRLCCAGSLLFLKQTYGVGYQLTIDTVGFHQIEESVTSASTESVIPSEDASSNIAGLVRTHIPQSSVLRNVGNSLKLHLPFGINAKFSRLLEDLDREVERCNATCYTLSMITMDEVFSLVVRSDTSSLGGVPRRDLTKAAIPKSPMAFYSIVELNDRSLFTRHVGALVKKRATIFLRDKKAWCCTTLLPSLAVFVGFLIYARAGEGSLPALALDTRQLNQKVSGNDTNPIAVNAQSAYTCLPGRCLVDEVYGYVETGEVYSYCLGVQRDEHACPLLSPLDILGKRGGTQGAFLVPAEGTAAVPKSSAFLGNNYTPDLTLQYGGVWITNHDRSSLSNSSERFDDRTVSQCYQKVDRGFQYLTYRDCDRLRGLGFLIQYNFTGLHTPVLLQALLDQALARSTSNDPELEIKATISPLPITEVEESFGSAEDVLLIWLVIILSFPFITGAQASFIVDERESKAKHLQAVAGVQPLAYWFSSLLWDTLNYQLPLWLTFAMMFAFDFDVMTTSRNGVLPGVLILLLLYGPAAAGYAYCASFAFKSTALCNVVLISSGSALALASSLAVFFTSMFVKEDLAGANVKFAHAFITLILRFFPACNLAKGLLFAFNNSVLSSLGQQAGQSVFSANIMMLEIVILGCQGVAYTGLATLLDVWAANPNAMGLVGKFMNDFLSWCKGGAITIPFSLTDDSDVVEEEDRVLNGGAERDLIKMCQLSKVYRNGIVAVERLSLSVRQGNCFGLLGTKGAGKTTALGMLSSEIPPSGGDATLSGFSIVREPQKIRRNIGYCPQFDAHFANMTGREHVSLYASVKGIHKNMMDYAVSRKLAEVGLSKACSDSLCSNYSRGMKRRLSIACATIGQPRIVLLDECSAGVDPGDRREIWKIVSGMMNGGNAPKKLRPSVILATQSMEECEALCPRIGILAEGRLKCLGSAQHIRHKFGQCYQAEITMKQAKHGDADFIAHASALAYTKCVTVDQETGEAAQNPSFSLGEVVSCLNIITDDTYLSSMISPQNLQGQMIWEASTSPTGVSLRDLSTFVTNEIRAKKIGEFILRYFPYNIIRERRDLKVRYELGDKEDIRIASVFAIFEQHKGDLLIEDYGVSQTSLEQVFNLHAAEAEAQNQ